MTSNYYDTHAELFITSTLHVDMSELYAPFIQLLSPNATILDAGCGSGRDTLAFSQLGFKVVAFDASEQMVEHARRITNGPVYCHTFADMNYDDQFDGIWACASLLHVNFADLREILLKFQTALKKKGAIYLSFKYGHEERVNPDGRVFTDINESMLTELLTHVSGLSLYKIWVTEDKRPQKKHEKWLNALLIKQL